MSATEQELKDAASEGARKELQLRETREKGAADWLRHYPRREPLVLAATFYDQSEWFGSTMTPYRQARTYLEGFVYRDWTCRILPANRRPKEER
jgi:hypothetical protein